jgi:UDP-N-acetylmuramate dehydrogenase
MATQPLDLPSCGSVFRNPPGDHAGRLVESVGLKGYRVGGAAISERHANFVVNLGGATASEVMASIRAAWEQVRERTGVTLIPEVHVPGA